MKVDFFFPPGPPLTARPLARRAADLGFDGFFTAETSHDPFLPLLVAAEETELELGTAIAVAFPRSPMVTAQIAWDLAAASSGRFILGLGTQVKAHITRRFSTEWGHPTARLRDYIGALRAIWDTWQNRTPLRYDGGFYRFSLMTPFFDPGPIEHPEIPVAIAGVGPHLSRLAGAVCDGFHVHPFHTVRYLDEVVLPNIAAGAKAEGRSLDDCERYSTVFVATGSNDSEIEQSLQAVKSEISFYASTPSYAPVLEASGWDFGPELTAMSKRGRWEEMASVIPDDVVHEIGVVAPIDRLGEAIRRRYGDRLQRVGLYNLGNLAVLNDGDVLSQIVADIKKG
ncbi:MAG TPA: TIGR03617 family F420-dependent LLM class oxidoreductase [Acidimicrobiia bacterium]|nr:TIGR03617 family F420-dependent LLM class oxidoreductase [Acidimicrobiia bacterium]